MDSNSLHGDPTVTSEEATLPAVLRSPLRAPSSSWADNVKPAVIYNMLVADPLGDELAVPGDMLAVAALMFEISNANRRAAVQANPPVGSARSVSRAIEASSAEGGADIAFLQKVMGTLPRRPRRNPANGQRMGLAATRQELQGGGYHVDQTTWWTALGAEMLLYNPAEGSSAFSEASSQASKKGGVLEAAGLAGGSRPVLRSMPHYNNQRRFGFFVGNVGGALVASGEAEALMALLASPHTSRGVVADAIATAASPLMALAILFDVRELWTHEFLLARSIPSIESLRSNRDMFLRRGKFGTKTETVAMCDMLCVDLSGMAELRSFLDLRVFRGWLMLLVALHLRSADVAGLREVYAEYPDLLAAVLEPHLALAGMRPIWHDLFTNNADREFYGLPDASFLTADTFRFLTEEVKVNFWDSTWVNHVATPMIAAVHAKASEARNWALVKLIEGNPLFAEESVMRQDYGSAMEAIERRDRVAQRGWQQTNALSTELVLLLLDDDIKGVYDLAVEAGEAAVAEGKASVPWHRVLLPQCGPRVTVGDYVTKLVACGWKMPENARFVVPTPPPTPKS